MSQRKRMPFRVAAFDAAGEPAYVDFLTEDAGRRFVEKVVALPPGDAVSIELQKFTGERPHFYETVTLWRRDQ